MAIFSPNYLRANTEQSKQIAIVIKIDGVPGYLSNIPIYSIVRYGDPDVFYGGPFVYGALRKRDDVRDILSLEGSSLTLSQRLEPEQGKGSISTLTFAFIDLDNFMTELCSPGVIVDEILGKEVTVQLGYQDISFPSDYFVIFRGTITATTSKTGIVTLQISDPNTKNRQYTFKQGSTNTTSSIDDTVTTIPVVSTNNFFEQILGPDATYDPAIKTYIKVDEEFMEYPAVGGTDATNFYVTRGARGTIPAPHDTDASVTSAVQIQDHCIDLALKVMLSGWDGNCIIDQPIQSIITTLSGVLGNINNSVTLPDDVDAVKDYGLVIGDYLTISNATDPLNDITTRITGFADPSSTQPNQVILTADDFNSVEYPTTALISFRSQYDTYPVDCGLKLTPRDVDVQGYIDLKNTFLASPGNSYRFLLTEQTQGKDWLESQVYLPVSVYSLTRRGKLSVKITKPPIGNASLITLDQDNIIDPVNITFDRGTNSRKFFNEISWQYDQTDAGVYLSIFDRLDSASLTIIGLSSVLPISSSGLRTDLTPDIEDTLTKRAQFFLSRYKRGAQQVNLKVNYGTGNLIEGGDIVALNGNGLSLPNFTDGTRDFGVQLFEVIERGLNLKDGNVNLKLINGVGASATDRFGMIAPSSVLGIGSTTTVLFLTDSFSSANPIFPGNEWFKWQNYVGQPIIVHNLDYSYTEQVTIKGFDIVNPNKMTVTPALSSAPPAGYIIDIPHYPNFGTVATLSTYKSIFTFCGPEATVATGTSDTVFDVVLGDEIYLFDGCVIRVHNDDFTIDSGDIFVKTVIGTTVTTSTPLGFTPSAGQIVDLIGFAIDRGGCYRWI